MAAVPKDLGNLTQGVQTYGFWESFLYFDTQAYDFWMFLANDCGMGLSVGLIAATVFTKALFAPNVLYSQMVGIKMKLLQPDMDKAVANMKRHA